MAVRLAKVEGAIKTETGWWEFPSGKLLVLGELAHNLVSQTHQATHLGHAACSQVNAASQVFRQKPLGKSLVQIIQLVQLQRGDLHTGFLIKVHYFLQDIMLMSKTKLFL